MKIVVLAGGISTEREVSLISGKGVYNALRERGHQVVLVDVYLGYDGDGVEDVFNIQKDWADNISSFGPGTPDINEFKKLRKGESKNFFGPGVLEICGQADIVFLALHGANGEDGRIQATLELMGIPFTGTDYLSSAICMDKALTRDMFEAHGIPHAKGYSIENGEPLKDMEYPQVVKVNTGGSSVGVYIVNDEKEMQAALEESKKYDSRVVIEQFIKGREFTCGVLAGKALPLVEIAPKEGFYDFANKYQPGQTKEQCPALLSEEKTKEIQQIAEKVYKVLRLRAYCRIDFMMDEAGNVYCLEANTLPGMTPTSLLPQEAQAVGIGYGELCEKIIEISRNAK